MGVYTGTSVDPNRCSVVTGDGVRPVEDRSTKRTTTVRRSSGETWRDINQTMDPVLYTDDLQTNELISFVPNISTLYRTFTVFLVSFTISCSKIKQPS